MLNNSCQINLASFDGCEALKMYEVACKCGHVGRKHYVLVHFPIKAANGQEAAKIARYMGRVKHDHKDAILSVERIGEERYHELMTLNRNDPYLNCHNIQEQRVIDITDRLVDEKEKVPYMKKKEKPLKILYYGKQKIRRPKYYINNFYNFEDNDWCA